jgi:hypothetical protein
MAMWLKEDNQHTSHEIWGLTVVYIKMKVLWHVTSCTLKAGDMNLSRWLKLINQPYQVVKSYRSFKDHFYPHHEAQGPSAPSVPVIRLRDRLSPAWVHDADDSGTSVPVIRLRDRLSPSSECEVRFWWCGQKCPWDVGIFNQWHGNWPEISLTSFWKSLLLPSAEQKSDHEDRCNMFLWNVGTHLSNYTASHPWRQQSSRNISVFLPPSTSLRPPSSTFSPSYYFPFPSSSVMLSFLTSSILPFYSYFLSSSTLIFLVFHYPLSSSSSLCPIPTSYTSSLFCANLILFFASLSVLSFLLPPLMLSVRQL